MSNVWCSRDKWQQHARMAKTYAKTAGGRHPHASMGKRVPRQHALPTIRTFAGITERKASGAALSYVGGFQRLDRS